MDKKSKDPGTRSPAATDDRDGVEEKSHEARAHLKRAEASLREAPEDRRDTARQTTPAGKARSK